MEYCDLWSLADVAQDYKTFTLCVAEHFQWHAYSSLAKALCFCKYGNDDGTPRPGWDEIGHCDIIYENTASGTVTPPSTPKSPGSDIALRRPLGISSSTDGYITRRRVGGGYADEEAEEDTAFFVSILAKDGREEEEAHEKTTK
ncbi:MAG: hypothetical protein M1826_005357, partial [Phylliscum demangeonii]